MPRLLLSCKIVLFTAAVLISGIVMCPANEVGKASFYGGRWIGAKTASGERYQAGDLTAAHRHLPFNTMVKVTNIKNGKSVVVRINNRGPYVKGRILDLSIKAAKAIEMISSGIANVKAEVLSSGYPQGFAGRRLAQQSPSH